MPRLARFLGVDIDPCWVTAATSVCQVRQPYIHDESLLERYRQLVGEFFDRDPEMAEQLLRFAE